MPERMKSCFKCEAPVKRLQVLHAPCYILQFMIWAIGNQDRIDRKPDTIGRSHQEPIDFAFGP